MTARKQAEQELLESREKLRALAARLEQVREEEQTRIARELHDELGQLLTALKMDLRWLERRLEPGQNRTDAGALLERVVAASELADETIKGVHRIAAELRPGLLDRTGLVPALRQECLLFQQRTGIPCVLRAPEPEPSPPADVATACYRICQEALTNVARHAAASAVEVEFRAEPAAWVLEVRDNGRGIAANEPVRAGSLGLIGMRERARQLGGEVGFQPGADGRGTVVRLRLPVRAG